MALLVQGITGNVLGAIGIEILKRKLIRILMSCCNSAEFRVLLPQIDFDEFRRRQEFENRGVPIGKRGPVKVGVA